MSKVKIRYSGSRKEYLEFPDKGCERSCSGSLHFKPGAVKEITSDEYAHIKSAYSHLRFEEIKQGKVHKVKSKAQEEKAEEKSEAEEESSEVSEEESKSDEEEASEAVDESQKAPRRKAKVKAKS